MTRHFSAARSLSACERGVSLVVSAILLLTIFFTFYSVYLAATVPAERAEKEEEHMLRVRESFLDLQDTVQNLSVGESQTITIKMSADPGGIFGGPRVGGRLSVETGRTTFDIQNPYYVPQTYVYENGAVILVQDNRNVMVSPSAMVTARDRENENIEVRVNTIMVIGSDEVAGTGTATLEVLVEDLNRVQPSNEPNLENVTIVIYSVYRTAWESYLSDLYDQLDGLGYNPVIDLSSLQIAIMGRVLASGENDIYYYEEYKEVRISVT